MFKVEKLHYLCPELYLMTTQPENQTSEIMNKNVSSQSMTIGGANTNMINKNSVIFNIPSIFL